MKSLTRLFITILFVPIISACMSNAYNLRDGIDSFKAEDYRRAFIRLKPEAEKGQPDAQYAVGYMYYYGKGVVENRKKAWFWINTAAGLGQPDAVVAIKMLQQGSFKKRKIFENRKLQHFPVDKGMY